MRYKRAFTKITVALVLSLLICFIGDVKSQAATNRGNFSSPTSSEITTSSAKISSKFTAKTYVKTCGYYMSSDRTYINKIYNQTVCAVPNVIENVNGNISKGTELYYSSTSTNGRISGLQDNTTYHYCFYYTDKSGRYYFSDIKDFTTKKVTPTTTKGNFSTPTASEITTSSAKISTKFTATTYVKTCGYYMGQDKTYIEGIANRSKNGNSNCEEAVNSNVSNGTELFYSSTSSKGKVTGLSSNTTYYYCFFYSDTSDNKYFSDVKSFTTYKEMSANTSRDYRSEMCNYSVKDDIEKATRENGYNCSLLSASFVSYYYDHSSDNSVDSYYWDMYSYNEKYGSPLYMHDWGHYGFKTSNGNFLPSIYEKLKYGPVIVGSTFPAVDDKGNPITGTHFAVVVAYTGTGGLPLNEHDFIIYDYQTKIKWDELEYTLDSWLKRWNMTLTSYMYR